VLFTFLTCPPNFLWQEYLEETFPGKQIELDGTTSLHRANTAKKFFLDQTIGALVNTAIFIGTFAAFKGKDGPAIQREVRRVCFSRDPFAARFINRYLGDLPADEEWMEAVASCLDTEFHCRPGPSSHPRGLGCWSFLGYFPEHACSRLMSAPELKLLPLHFPEPQARDAAISISRPTSPGRNKRALSMAQRFPRCPEYHAWHRRRGSQPGTSVLHEYMPMTQSRHCLE
jgi:hypothetical protein